MCVKGNKTLVFQPSVHVNNILILQQVEFMLSNTKMKLNVDSHLHASINQQVSKAYRVYSTIND